MAERLRGTVKVFDKIVGRGIVEMPDGREAHIRYSSIRGQGVRRLTKGAAVSFLLQETRRGLYAVCVQQE